MLMNCTPATYAANDGRTVRLGKQSRDPPEALRDATGIVCDDRMQGTLQLFRKKSQVAVPLKDIAVLREGGVAFEVLDAEGCLAIEPGPVAARHEIACGLRPTLPVTDDALAPSSTVMDETYKVAIARLGDWIRVGELAEIAGFDLSLPERHGAKLPHSDEWLFPGAGEAGRASIWCGMRPMTPDRTPVVGRTAVPGRWLSNGRGTLGWTMPAGWGRGLADLMAGARATIDTADLGIGRYGRDGA